MAVQMILQENGSSELSVGMKLASNDFVCWCSCLLSSRLSTRIQLVVWLWRKLMYEVLTQLLAILNYQVIATDIGEDTIALEI